MLFPKQYRPGGLRRRWLILAAVLLFFTLTDSIEAGVAIALAALWIAGEVGYQIFIRTH